MLCPELLLAGKAFSDLFEAYGIGFPVFFLVESYEVGITQECIVLVVECQQRPDAVVEGVFVKAVITEHHVGYFYRCPEISVAEAFFRLLEQHWGNLVLKFSLE